jgi:hypothetical protein
MRLKRSKQNVQAQRLDMQSLLSLIDQDLAERSLISRTKKKGGTFFEELQHLSSHTNQCPPGSILPSVKSPVRKRAFNCTHRSVGFASPPKEPYNQLSRVSYNVNLHTNQLNQLFGSKPQKKTRSLSKTKRLSKTKNHFTASGLGILQEEQMLKDIQELHRASVVRAARSKKNTIGTGHALFDLEVKAERKEFRLKLNNRMINDADVSVQKVVARENRRLEKLHQKNTTL